jgi:ribose transport system ATP-binding protein
MEATTPPLLEMEGIEKSFPGVRALKNGRLTLHQGEVLALLGENGAGKSTLMKILAGALRPDVGAIRLDGQTIELHSPLDAQRRGIAVIYQEFNLVPELTVRENIFLGREHTGGGFLREGDEREKAAALFVRMNVRIDPETRVADLTVAQQQLVEIAKALAQEVRILVMDEPTAALTNQEVGRLFALIADLKARGIGIIYISHRLDEVFAVADRATIMRDGEYIDTRPIAELTRERVIELMVGRTLDSEFPQRAATVGEERLVVRGLRRGDAVKDVSFSVRGGEVVGLTGLVGAGRTEVARLLFGADRPDSGEVFLDGRRLDIRSPKNAVENGICLLTEDRKEQGLILDQSLRANFGLPNLGRLSRFGFVDDAKERSAFAEYIKMLRIKTPSEEQLARNLSGGNQQKVVLAKWLFADSEVILFDEPTRGIDVGAKYEIYLLINDLAARGKAILMISSELPEVLGMSDRILVMRDGRITGEITDVPYATQEQVMRLMMA